MNGHSGDTLGFMRRLPGIITLSPGGILGERATVAGVRSGALGVLDLGFVADPRAARAAVGRTSALLKGREFGIRVVPEAVHGPLLERSPDNLSAVVLAGGGAPDWRLAFEAVARWGRRGVAEVTDREQAVEAARAGFDHLIVVGNEAGGFVSEEPAFILLQAVLRRIPASCRVWVRGGIGPATAAGCLAGGASGVVLDGALWLARESPLPSTVRDRIATWDGVETTVVAVNRGLAFRGFAAPGSALLGQLRELDGPASERLATLNALSGWGDGQLWPAGQDVAFSAELARRHVTVGGIVQAVEAGMKEGLASARLGPPLAAGSALAVSHGTRFPIVQGPMTRVSDRPAFALAVAEGGGLPFLALALMRGAEVSALLRDAKATLGERPWGVGLLAFNTPELRREQTECILDARPPFVLIAGGRPDQAAVYEQAGIPTYLHAPSPGLLAQFLREGSRRFVLEGRECGGHVGPRTSFVLWEQAGRVVREAIDGGTVDPTEVHLLYAGGIHDARSAAIVSAVAATLSARGVKVGALVGTAYLFTREATETGAVVEGYQRETFACETTVLLETGPGHQVRVSPSPYTKSFETERRNLLAKGRSTDEIRESLEGLNVGRLRVAAKGVDRIGGARGPLSPVNPEVQRAEGLYMLGQAATLRDALTTIEELHGEIARGSLDFLTRDPEPGRSKRRRKARPSHVAIVGMASLVPGAADVRRFWENTLNRVDSIIEVPDDRWNWRLYYDADPKAPDKITSRWGGFVPEIPFDPLQYGMPPTSLPSIEPLHLLTLEVVRAALDDAGYRERAFPRERTAVVLGAGGGAAQLAMGYAFRSYLPLLDTVIPGAGAEALAKCGHLLPEWTEDSFPGILLNVAAGRVANRFDFGGSNFTVDAACGSSLAAAAVAVRELESGAADVVVLGGVDTVQNPFTYLAFSKTQAFSPRGRCRPFDAKADGIVISEGVAVVVLKRLADAERDGDKIYAVIKGLGSSSDGRAKGLTAPRFEGQVRALERAYENSGVSPLSIGYVEAHGTGTAAGDHAEVSALKDVFTEAGAEPGRCALGSVKSLIGHTKCAAGLAGLINAALALHHKVLPPTIGVETTNPKAGISGSPFHVSTRPRPWLRHDPRLPRRAGVSAFGFGGTNFHAVLEAYEGDSSPPAPAVLDWPAELFVWRDETRERLAGSIGRLSRAVQAGPVPALRDLARMLALDLATQAGECRLAIVATSADDLAAKIARALQAIEAGEAGVVDPTGVLFSERGEMAGAKVAFLFPGQGSQTPDMLGELALFFPEIVEAFDAVDGALVRRGFKPVGPLTFPPPALDEAEAERQRAALAAPDASQPALAAASLGLLDVLATVGVEPAVVAGHSFGELVALHHAGAFTADALAELSASRGRFLLASVGDEPGAMAAVQGGPEVVEPLLAGLPGVVLANRNGPRQTVVSGPREGVARFVETARAQGLRVRSIPVACGFHSPLVAGATAPLAESAARVVERGPSLPVYSNVDAATYSSDPEEIAQRIGAHVASPVRFAEMIEAMHADGARVFVEVGPGSVLTSLVGSILGDRAHLAVACDPPAGRGVAGLLATLGRLFVAGISIDLRPLTAARVSRRVTLKGDRFEGVLPELSPSTWLVNGSRARPWNGPEPARLGPGPALPPVENRASPPVIEAPAKAARGPLAAPGRPAAASPAGSAAVVAAFQETMRKFLDVQRSTMLSYLGSSSLVEPETLAPVSSNGHPGPAPVTQATAPLAVPAALTNGHETTSRKDENFGPEEVERRLLAIVRDRTGYPVEMLRLDLDLEADLGIDSIKRVEIIGSLRDAVPVALNGSESDLMDQLARARTLGAILEKMNRYVSLLEGERNGRAKNLVPAQEEAQHENGAAVRSKLRRMVLDAVDAPLSEVGRGAALRAGGVVLITDDGRGIAEAAAERLRWNGFRVVRVVHEEQAELDANGEAWRLDLAVPEQVARLIAQVGAEGPLCGVLHLLPLQTAADAGVDMRAWSGRLAPELRGLFLIARAAADALAQSGKNGGAALLAATGMGGGMASLGAAPADFFPGHGAVAGLVKTLAREWPDVRARVVDVDPREDADDLAAIFVEELLADDNRTEVGYRDGRRIVLQLVEVELPASSDEGVELRPGEPILITGGARGITAAVARDLARRWRPTFLLIGTSPLPWDENDAELNGLHGVAEIKAKLLERLSRSGRLVGPAELERSFRAWKKDQEIRSNIRSLRALGSLVEYAQVDVRDSRALGEALGVWKARYGPIIGLIHGAGVIQDKLLRDKSPESFDHVVGTKLDGALALAGLIDPKALRFAVFFSSVAGRFGNRGQVDYAAANEALNKLAVWLDNRWPGRVVSMIWGPWSGVGMVSDLEEHLGRQGFGMIDPDEGFTRLGDELARGRKGEVEVIVAGDLGNLVDTPETVSQP